MSNGADHPDLITRARLLIATCSAYNDDDESPEDLASALHDCLQMIAALADELELRRRQ